MRRPITLLLSCSILFFALSCDKEEDNSGMPLLFLGLSGHSSNWVQDAYLKASNADAGDYFGWSVAVSGDTIVAGTYKEAGNQSIISNTDGAASGDNNTDRAGAAYVFKKDGSGTRCINGQFPMVIHSPMPAGRALMVR